MMFEVLSKGWRSICPALLVLAVASSATAADSQAAAAESRRFHVAPQPLASALLACAEQAGIQIVFQNEVLGNRWSSGLDGFYAPAEAVDALLRDTGLRHEFSGKNTIVIPATTSPVNESPRTGESALNSSSHGE